MKPLIIYRGKDGELKADFSTEKGYVQKMCNLSTLGWEVFGVVFLKSSIVVQKIETNRKRTT